MPSLEPPTSKPDLDPRIPLAAERTLLAWVRTGLAMMGFGFVVARFGLFLYELAAGHGDPPGRRGAVSLALGVGLVLLGVAVNAFAAVRHVRYLRALAHGQTPTRTGAAEVMLCAVLAVGGLAMATYLVYAAR